MVIEDLGINGFRFAQDSATFKLGTDAVLLSDFARVRGRVCDLGCGSGAVTVLLAARHPRIALCGVEIQESAAALARENAALNALQDRMEVRVGDLCRIEEIFSPGSFDAVVSNPPYFPVGSGVPMELEEQRIAKMEIACTVRDVCRAAGYLLQEGGLFSLVYRPERLAELFAALAEAGFAPKRMRMVQNKPSAEPSLVLIEARKGAKPGLRSLPVLCIREEDGRETLELQKIYHKIHTDV